MYNLDKEEYTVRVTKYVEPIVTLKNIEGYTLEVVDTSKAIVEDNKIKGVEVGETTLRVLGTGTEIVKEVIASLGATSMKDMGKVMGTLREKTAGKADGKLVSDIVKAELSKL